MEDIEFRAIVKFLGQEGESAGNIHKRLFKVYKRNTPRLDKVKKWLSPEDLPKHRDLILPKHRDLFLRPDAVKLIKLYKNNPIMWNYNLPDYRNAELRSQIYQQMANELNTSVEVVIKKIQNLRSQWQMENRKIKQRSNELEGGNISYVSTWWAFNRLKFLDDEAIQQTIVEDTPHQVSPSCHSTQQRSLLTSPIGVPNPVKPRRPRKIVCVFRPEGNKFVYLPKEKVKKPEANVKAEPVDDNCASMPLEKDDSAGNDLEIKKEPLDDFETEDNKNWTANIEQFSEQGS